MADETANENRFARDQQGPISAATAIGMNALKAIMHFQVSMLRMWADSLERLAAITKRGWKKPRPPYRNSRTRNAPRKSTQWSSRASWRTWLARGRVRPL